MKSTLTITLSLLVLTPACKPDRELTETPEVEQPSAPAEEIAPEVIEGRQRYIMGFYQESIDTLRPAYERLSQQEDRPISSGLAAGWLALTLAEDVVEDAEAPAAYAMENAEATGDASLLSVAHMARGAHAFGMDDFAGAREHFGKAEAAATSSGDVALAKVFAAEAHIGLAFGGGGSMELQHPEELERAKRLYTEAAESAKAAELSNALLGRVYEGLAAVAKYQGKKSELCDHATAAKGYLQAANAAPYLVEGPAAPRQLSPTERASVHRAQSRTVHGHDRARSGGAFGRTRIESGRERAGLRAELTKILGTLVMI